MITVNSISGGATSSYIAANYPADYNVFALVCIDDPKCAPKDPSIIQYVNAKLESFIPYYGEFIATAEDDRTLVALRDLEQFIGKEIIWVRGKSYDEVINERYQRVLLGNRKWLPSWARRYCTEEMKLVPIFLWWLFNVGEKVNMRIGFRYDECQRMENFFNNSDPTNFKYPVQCSTRGKRRQKLVTYNWRNCSIPLIKDGITTQHIKDFWRNKYVGYDNLFETRRLIEFPKISNCVGCFHKKAETLAVQAAINTPKMEWFARQEHKGMGTWLDSRVMYDGIIAHALSSLHI